MELIKVIGEATTRTSQWSHVNRAKYHGGIAALLFFRRMHELGMRRVVFGADGTVHTRSGVEKVNNEA